MLIKQYLLAPGPTPIPEKVLAAAARQIIHHRTPEFSEVFSRVTEGLKYVFQTQEDVYILTSSGTGAMEASVANLLNRDDRVLCINSGKFGARWGTICRAYGVNVEEIELHWGDDFTPQQLAEKLARLPEAKAVFTSLSETSTGTVYDIHGYARVVSETDAVLVVDGISGVGATPCPMDEWEVDVLIAGSQKSFMIPPGLSYIAFSPKAWKLAETASLPRFYFDVRSARKSLRRNTSAWTPATSLVIQQLEALELIRSWGLDKLFRHHEIMGEATRAGIRAMDLELLSKKPGNILTAVKTPSGMNGSDLVEVMHRKFKVYIAGAQDPHKGKFFRIGHLGYQGGFDIITALSALDMSLAELDNKHQPGRAVPAAQEILKEYWP